MKRALFIVLTDRSGGAERVAASVARELMRRGWHVQYLVMCSRNPDGSFTDVGLSQGAHVSFGAARNWYFSYAVLPFRIIGGRYHLVFCTHVYTNAMVSAFRRCRLIRTDRLVLRESATVFDRLAVGWKKRLFRLLYRAYGGEDLLITQTEYMSDHVRPWLPARSIRKVRCLPNPVDLAAIAEATTAQLRPDFVDRVSSTINILFCGKLESVKRPDVALKTFAELRRLVSVPLRLILMGDGSLKDSVQAEALTLGLQNQVLLLGEVENPFPIMATAHYGLITSEREGFPNVLLEMMACGIRKIWTTPCAGGLVSLPGLGVVDNHDPMELASGLAASINTNEDQRAAYSSVVQKRSIAQYVTELLGDQRGVVQ
jgi:glycosyltransferase involved in cell wall biosynthesis